MKKVRAVLLYEDGGEGLAQDIANMIVNSKKLNPEEVNVRVARRLLGF